MKGRRREKDVPLPCQVQRFSAPGVLVASMWWPSASSHCWCAMEAIWLSKRRVVVVGDDIFV